MLSSQNFNNRGEAPGKRILGFRRGAPGITQIDAVRELAGRPPRRLEYSPTVWVVDDSEVNRRIFRYQLCRLGYTVIEAANGHEGLELLGHLPAPDLILLDLDMPIVDGRTFLQQLTERGLDTIPVVVVTASPVCDNLDLLEFEGVRDVFPKPYTIKKLLDVIQPVVERQ